jgi:hypothetical protein
MIMVSRPPSGLMPPPGTAMIQLRADRAAIPTIGLP